MVVETTPVYTRRHWAKSDRENRRSIHLLEHHLADVGACFEVLLEQTTIRQRLARTAGQADLDSATVARLCVFAALHDIGKINTGFQTQIWTTTDLRFSVPSHRLAVSRWSSVVQAVAPLAFRRLEALPAGRPVGPWSRPVGDGSQSSDPASVSLLTPAVLGVLKARRAGLLS